MLARYLAEAGVEHPELEAAVLFAERIVERFTPNPRQGAPRSARSHIRGKSRTVADAALGMRRHLSPHDGTGPLAVATGEREC
jgi:hypothetical protein